MTFRLVPNPTFVWPVRFSLPSHDEPGKFVEHGFMARFHLLSRIAIDGLIVRVRDESWSVNQFVAEVVVSLRDVTDAEGQPLPYTPELLAQCCAVPGVANAIAQAFMVAISPPHDAQATPAAAA